MHIVITLPRLTHYAPIIIVCICTRSITSLAFHHHHTHMMSAWMLVCAVFNGFIPDKWDTPSLVHLYLSNNKLSCVGGCDAYLYSKALLQLETLDASHK